MDDICVVIWKMIATARTRGYRDEEAGLKALARAFGCSSKPDSVEIRAYPEIDDIPPPTPPPFSEQWYRVGFQVCSAAPERIFNESGTKDPQAAASWVAEKSAADDESGRAGLFQGCFDALTGETMLPTD